MTQATDDWQPADDNAKLMLTQQQPQALSTMTPNSHITTTTTTTADTPVQLVNFGPRPHNVIDHVTADKDGGRVNTAFSQE